MTRTCLLGLSLSAFASAHDVWIETATARTAEGEKVAFSLFLGNHGNHHRDFKPLARLSREWVDLTVRAPDGTTSCLRDSLREGRSASGGEAWAAEFPPTQPGLHTFVSRFDRVMSYGPVRDVKCAKAFVMVGPGSTKEFDSPVGAPFEIVPLTDPITARVGTTARFRVLRDGRPMAGALVAVLPRGSQPTGDFDPRYEGLTGADGTVRMPWREAAPSLVAARWKDEKASGPGYDSVHYSATLFVTVKPGR